MPKIYTRTQKEHALYLIEELGSVTAVSRYLHIPARTLRDWRDLARRRELFARRDPTTVLVGSTGDINARKLRDDLLERIHKILQLEADAPLGNVYHAALAIDHHLDQLERLNRVLDIAQSTAPAPPPPTQTADDP